MIDLGVGMTAGELNGSGQITVVAGSDRSAYLLTRSSPCIRQIGIRDSFDVSSADLDGACHFLLFTGADSRGAFAALSFYRTAGDDDGIHAAVFTAADTRAAAQTLRPYISPGNLDVAAGRTVAAADACAESVVAVVVIFIVCVTQETDGFYFTVRDRDIAAEARFVAAADTSAFIAAQRHYISAVDIDGAAVAFIAAAYACTVFSACRRDCAAVDMYGAAFAVAAAADACAVFDAFALTVPP